MAVEPRQYSGLRLTARSTTSSPDLPSASALALAVAFPIVFIHIRYQPSVVIGSGTTVTVTLADLAVLGVALLALVAALRTRLAPLRPGLPVWAAGAAFLVFGMARAGSGTHLVSAVKFAEYAALAVAVPLLVRSRRDLQLLLGVVVAWAVVAAIVGLAQFFGADLAHGWGAGTRQPSFLGQLDFAALAGMAFAVGLTGLAFGVERVAGARGGRSVVAAGLVAGGLGLILSASVAALAGVGVATAVTALVALHGRRLTLRATSVGAVAAALVVAGTLALRGGDLVQFTRFLGVSHEVESTSADVQTYGQRTVLVYIGWLVFLDHKAVGAGWGASADPGVFEPHLPAAHREFPNAAPLSFPSRTNRWGVQNAYVQALADLGAVGLTLLAALLAAGLWAALRTALGRGVTAAAAAAAAPLGVLALSWTVVTMGVWAALGLIAGVPADAALWLGLGLAAAAPLLVAAPAGPLPPAPAETADEPR